MEMQLTPITTPASPVASSLGIAASFLQLHGTPAAPAATGGGRGNADDAVAVFG